MFEPIYVFNGKDITNLFCFQVRDVARIIAQKERVTFPVAVGLFYASETYRIMREVENTLWAENAEFIADRYYEEMAAKNRPPAIAPHPGPSGSCCKSLRAARAAPENESARWPLPDPAFL